MKKRKLLVIVGCVLAAGIVVLARAMGFWVSFRPIAHTTKRLQADHPAVRQFKEALESRSILRDDFPHVTDELRKATKAFSQQAPAGMLPPVTRFQFISGIEFLLSPGGGQTRTVPAPVEEEGEDLDNPSVFRLPGSYARQAYVIYSSTEPAKEATYLTSLLLLKTQGAWVAASMNTSPSEIGGRTARALFGAAQEAESSGRKLEALALYAAASQLAMSSPFRQTAIQQRLVPKYQKLAQELGVGKRPLASVTTVDGRLNIDRIDARVGVGGAFAILELTVDRLESRDAMEARQERIARAFVREYPGFREHFSGLAVGEFATGTAAKREGWRSVYRFPELDSE